MSKESYLKTLQLAFLDLHGCQAKYVETVPVLETFQGKTVWEGEVEVFELIGHPEAKRGYAWSYDKDGKSDQVTAVLELPPVISPKTAVQIAIASSYRSGNQGLKLN